MPPGALTPIRLGFPSHGGGSLPVWAASRLGIFRRNGIDVGQTLLHGSVNVVEALLAGEIQFANMASPAVVEANVRLPGADLVYLASGRIRIAQQFLGAPDLASFEDLRGRRVGARASAKDRFTDLDSTLWRYALTRAGLDPATDVTYVEVDSHSDLVDALATGRVDAGLVVPPYAYEAQRRGLKVLLDGRDIDLPYQLGGTVARRSFVESAPEVALQFVRSYSEGLSRVLSDAPLARGLVRDYSRITDPTVAEQTVEFYHGVLSYPPYPSVPGIGTVIDQLAQRVPEARALRPEDCVELGPIRRLEAEGFFDDVAPAATASKGSPMTSTTDGTMQLYGEYHERQQPRCVVLLHALGLNSRIWDGLVGLLSPSSAVLTLDLRGHGLSWLLPDDPHISVDRLADDVAASVRALGRESVTVVGTSLGAAVALALAARHPGLVDGLGLVGLPGEASLARLDALAVHAEEGRLEALAGQQAALWFSDAFRASARTTVAPLTDAFVRSDPSGLAGACRALASFDAAAAAGEVRAPVVVLTGAEDVLAPPDDARAVAGRLGAAATVVPGCRHLVVVERPDAVAGALAALAGSAA